MGGQAARELIKQLSLYNACLGGAQLSTQFVLATLRQFLIFATPFTGGLSLAPAAPVALAQAALAVHTTKITGKLAAQILVRGTQEKGPQPSAMLHRLASQDPGIKIWLSNWTGPTTRETTNLKALLP